MSQHPPPQQETGTHLERKEQGRKKEKKGGRNKIYTGEKKWIRQVEKGKRKKTN
jgi:hypothetical protein